MKITEQNLPELLKKHIFLLTQEELESACFILSISITEYSKSEHEVSFKMQNDDEFVYVECGKGSVASIARRRLSEEEIENNGGMSDFTCYGGVWSLAHVINTVRYLYLRGYMLSHHPGKDNTEYEPEEFLKLVSQADAIVMER